jgi:hypothetical protein
MLEPTVSEALLEAVAYQYKSNKLSLQGLKEGLSEHQVLYLVYQGAYHILAHKRSQSKRNAEAKLGREILRKCEADPELAERAGLGKRVELS